MKWLSLKPIVGSDGGSGGSVLAPLGMKTPCANGDGLVLLPAMLGVEAELLVAGPLDAADWESDEEAMAMLLLAVMMVMMRESLVQKDG